MKVTANEYKTLRKDLKTIKINKLASETGISRTTLYRVKKSKSYNDYKKMCIIDSHKGLQPYNTTDVDDIIYDSGPRKNWFQRLFQ